MRKILLILFLITAVLAEARVPKVSFDDLNSGGWERYQGQTVVITTPLYVCGLYYDSLILATERLYVPEEHATGLADGDSTMLYAIRRHNDSLRICLNTRYTPFDLHIGSTIRGLQAMITAPHKMLTGKAPRIIDARPTTTLPPIGNADMTICSANIQNFFYDLGGYAQRKTTRAQFDLQALKIATALTRINADLYALCELQRGDKAPAELARRMNELVKSDRYDYVVTDTRNGDTISVGFVYRKDRIEPYGPLSFAYRNDTNIYCRRFMVQGFRHLSSGEQFILSLNHPRSKHGDAAESNRKRMANIDSILTCIDRIMADNIYQDEDLLLLGDYNCYTEEQPIQTLLKHGLTDLIMRDDSLGYSYNFNGEQGYLDRAFANPSMAAQVTAVHPIHWNTDCYYSVGFKSRYNYRGNHVPDSTKDIRRDITPKAKRNLIFRYSDHDPLLLGIRFNSRH